MQKETKTNTKKNLYEKQKKIKSITEEKCWESFIYLEFEKDKIADGFLKIKQMESKSKSLRLYQGKNKIWNW